MRLILIALFTSLYFISPAQTTYFEDTQNMFIGIESGESEFVDVDGDGDLDIFITGNSDDPGGNTKLYINDGSGNFSETVTSIPQLRFSTMAFADVDGDNDLDILIAGQPNDPNIDYATFLYLNDGAGNFTDSNESFQQILASDVGFADIDNDADQDIFIIGITDNPMGPFTFMYVNDGSGNYSLIPNKFTPALIGKFKFADIDGDNDPDLLIIGWTGELLMMASTLYENDGNGNFTKIGHTPFENLGSSSIYFADIDGDQDQDVLLTGSSDKGLTTLLYINNGLGEYILKDNTGIVNVYFGESSFSDVDLDGDLDLLIIGRKNSALDGIAKLYFNDGNGNFTEDLNSNFIGASDGSVDFGDIDGDGDIDALISGFSPDGMLYSKLYINDFTLATESHSFSFQLNLFPNPCKDYLMLETEIQMDEITIELSNSTGQILNSNYFQNVSTFEIPVLSLIEGLYFLKISDGNNRSETISFVKEEY